MRLVPEWLTQANSRSRGWLCGVGLLFVMLAILGRIPSTDAFVKTHEWVLWIPIIIAAWAGRRFHEHANPMPAMGRDVRTMLPPHVMAWSIVAIIAVVFLDQIKNGLNSLLPTEPYRDRRRAS